MDILTSTIREMQANAKEFGSSFRDYYNSQRKITQVSKLYSESSNQVIKARNKFIISFESIPTNLFSMTLDFNPLLEAFELNVDKERFILMHWNTGPRVPNVRMGEFGFYIADKGKVDYRVIPHDQMVTSMVSTKFLQIENTATLPSAVVLYRDCIMEETELGNIITQL